MSPLSYRVGELELAELNWVLATFKKSYREACPDLRTDDFYRLQSAVCDEILSRFPTILVARNDDGVALGWIAAEGSSTALTVHYSYVKSSYRRMGVFGALLAAVNDRLADAGDLNQFTHRTRRTHILEKLGFSHIPVGRFIRENQL